VVNTIISESFRTHLVRPWRLMAAILGSAIALTVPAALEVVAAASLRDLIADEDAKGRFVLVVEDAEGDLSSRDCAALGGLGGVRRAGGVTSPEVVGIGLHGLVQARRVFATSAFFAIVGFPLPSDPRPVVVLGPGLTEEVSFADGAPVTLSDGGSFGVVGSVVAQRLPAAMERWVFVPAPPRGDVQQCWIEAERGAAQAIQAATPSFFPGARALTVERLRDAKVTDQAMRAWEERPMRYLSAGAGAMAALLVAAVIWPRRSEYALYRFVGMPHPHVVLVALLESTVPLAGAVMLSVLSLMSFFDAGTLTVTVGLLHLLIGSAVAAAAQLSIAVVLASGDRARILRRR